MARRERVRKVHASQDAMTVPRPSSRHSDRRASWTRSAARPGIDAESQGVAEETLAGLLFESDDHVPRIVTRRLEHRWGLRPEHRHTIMTLGRGETRR